MKTKSSKKFEQPELSGSMSRDKARKLYSESRAAEKSGKSKSPVAERRMSARAARHKSKGLLKQIQVKFNG